MTFSADAPTAPRYSWAEIWTAVLIRPSVQTFQQILGDPQVSRRRAYTWMLMTWTINAIFIGLLRAGAVNEAIGPSASGRFSPFVVQWFMIVSTICAVPITLIMGFIGFRISIAFVKFVSWMLGGRLAYVSGVKTEKAKNSDFTSDKHQITTLVTYSLAAIQAPLNVVTLLFAALPASPLVALISFAGTCYQGYLMALSLRAIYGFSMGRALASIILSFVLFLFTIFATIVAVAYIIVRL